jgi:hypothetical protein
VPVTAAVVAKPSREMGIRTKTLASISGHTIPGASARALCTQSICSRPNNVEGLIRSMYRGAPFGVNLLIAWIRTFAQLDRPPVVAQIIGRNDSRVNVSDSLDLLQFAISVSRQSARSTHESIVRPRVWRVCKGIAASRPARSATFRVRAPCLQTAGRTRCS